MKPETMAHASSKYELVEIRMEYIVEPLLIS
jgi:hypothetical protein